jgi:hypothetical protein
VRYGFCPQLKQEKLHLPPRFFEWFVSVPQTTLHPKRHRIFVEFTLTEIQKKILDTNSKDDTFTAIRCITVDAPGDGVFLPRHKKIHDTHRAKSFNDRDIPDSNVPFD